MVDAITQAFDATFLLRFAFALTFYWVWGILSKGIFEPLQANLGRRLFAYWHRSNIDLYQKAIQSCGELDDLILGYISNASGRINEIVNCADLTSKQKAKHQELIKEVYSLSVLLDKVANGR